jgi:tetratricopeptide (TPR) repeat protein
MELSALLPGWDSLEERTLKISVMHGNREIGWIRWEIKPFVEDWLERAERVINPEQRLALLERAAERAPEDRRLQRKLADEYEAAREWQKAAGILERLAGKNPDQDQLRRLLALYAAMGSQQKAAWAAGELVRLDPENPEFRRGLAQIHEKAGRLKEALSEYEVFVRLAQGAERGPALKHLGYLYTKAGRPQEAIEAYLKAFELDPGDANLCYNLSDLYDRTGRKDKAELWLKKALELNPQDLQSRMRLAEGLLREGKLDEADRALADALKKAPTHLPALLLRAQVKEKQGDKNELRRVYERILALEPQNETVIYNLGALEYELGNLKGSLPRLEKYAKLHPKDIQVHELLFAIYRKLGNRPLAAREAQILVGLNRHQLAYYSALFDFLKSSERYEETVNWMEKGVQAMPAQTELREYLAFAYLKTGRELQALAQMEVLLKTRPKDPTLWLEVARLREKGGNLSGAIEAYARVITLSPGNTEAEEAYLRLRLKKVQRAE